MGDLSAATLLSALQAKHAEDVFVAECKNGPSYGDGLRRLDAWVMLRTWSPVTMIGYEIKVSKADWRRDTKLTEYMGLCHLFSIVAPKGVVPIEELPEGVGLLEPVGTQGRLQARRKAARREITLPGMLMVYVLMARAKLSPEKPDPYDFDGRRWTRDRLAEWVKEKGERRTLHIAVSAKIREVFDSQERDLRRLEDRMQSLERIERRISELGFDPSKPFNEWQVEQRIRQVAGLIDADLLRKISATETALGKIRAGLEKMVPHEVGAADG